MSGFHKTRSGLMEKIRTEYPATHLLGLALAGCRIRVAFSDQMVRDHLTVYFEPFRHQAALDSPHIEITVHQAPDEAVARLFSGLSFATRPLEPGKTRIKEEFHDLPDGRIVKKRLTRMAFVFGENQHLAVGPCLDNENQVVNFINNRFLEWGLCNGAILGHAAGVILNGKGLALAGVAGAGKSTLALHIMRNNALFISNDRLLVQKTGQGLTMYGVAKLPRVNPGTVLHNPSLAPIMSEEERRRFSRLDTHELWQLEHKYDAPIDTCFGPDRFVLQGPMNALAVLKWRRGGEKTRIRKVDPAQSPHVVQAFAKSPGLFFLPSQARRTPDPGMDTYVAHLAHCEVFEVSGGVDFETAANRFTEYLTLGASPDL